MAHSKQDGTKQTAQSNVPNFNTQHHALVAVYCSLAIIYMSTRPWKKGTDPKKGGAANSTDYGMKRK
jgi:hypothetical protein